MALRFTVLASGSGGNATLLETDGVGVLLDAGLGPRLLAGRLADVGASWASLHAVLLTHTHSDHWDDGTLTQLWQRKIPLHCHPLHRSQLQAWSRGFLLLESAGLVHEYHAGQEVTLGPGLRCLPLPVRHDSIATFGFRFDGAADLFGDAASLAYAADLGCWDSSLAASLADVELLALEFNHDVTLEVASGRSAALIARVLGDEGHLSNEQAAALVKEIVHRSTPGRLKHLILLHLSRECNRAQLAEAAARAALGQRGQSVTVQAASQHEVGPTYLIGGGANQAKRRAGRGKKRARRAEQDWLPGLEPRTGGE